VTRGLATTRAAGQAIFQPELDGSPAGIQAQPVSTPATPLLAVALTKNGSRFSYHATPACHRSPAEPITTQHFAEYIFQNSLFVAQGAYLISAPGFLYTQFLFLFVSPLARSRCLSGAFLFVLSFTRALSLRACVCVCVYVCVCVCMCVSPCLSLSFSQFYLKDAPARSRPVSHSCCRHCALFRALALSHSLPRLSYTHTHAHVFGIHLIYEFV